MSDHVRPVYSLPRVGTRGYSALQQAYVTHFGDTKVLDAYEQLKDPLLPGVIAARVVRWQEQTARHPHSETRVLDIGGADGRMLGRILDELGKRRKCAVRPTVLDAANTRLHSDLGRHAPVFVPDKRFDDFEASASSFDLIVACHAWYMIDPLQLLRAFRMLAGDGLLCIVQATRSNNALASLSDAVDESLDSSTPIVERELPPFEYVATTTGRVYADEIEAVLHAALAAPSAIVTNDRCAALGLDRFVAKDRSRLTEAARTVLHAFADDHRSCELDRDSIEAKAVQKLLDLSGSGQTVPLNARVIEVYPRRASL